MRNSIKVLKRNYILFACVFAFAVNAYAFNVYECESYQWDSGPGRCWVSGEQGEDCDYVVCDTRYKSWACEYWGIGCNPTPCMQTPPTVIATWHCEAPNGCACSFDIP